MVDFAKVRINRAKFNYFTTETELGKLFIAYESAMIAARENRSIIDVSQLYREEDRTKREFLLVLMRVEEEKARP